MTIDTIISEQPNLITRDIPGFEGYYAMRNDGRVISLARDIYLPNGSKRHKKELMLKQTKHKTEYPYILYVGGNSYSIGRNALYRLTFPELFKPVEILKGEIWKEIPSTLHSYSVSNMGRVKRNTEVVTICGCVKYTHMEYLMIPFPQQISRRLLVKLPDETGEFKGRMVARYVYEAFNRPLKACEIIWYHDNDVSNVKLENLFIT